MTDGREEHEERLLTLNMIIEGGVQERGDIFKAAAPGERIKNGPAFALVIRLIGIDKRSIEEFGAALFHADTYRSANFRWEERRLVRRAAKADILPCPCLDVSA